MAQVFAGIKGIKNYTIEPDLFPPTIARAPNKSGTRLYSAQEIAEETNVNPSEIRRSLARYVADLRRGGQDPAGCIALSNGYGEPLLDRTQVMAFLYWRSIRGSLPHFLNLGRAHLKNKRKRLIRADQDSYVIAGHALVPCVFVGEAE